MAHSIEDPDRGFPFYSSIRLADIRSKERLLLVLNLLKVCIERVVSYDAVMGKDSIQIGPEQAFK